MRRFGWRFWAVSVAVTGAVTIVGALLVLWLPEGWQAYTFLAAAAITGALTLWAYLRSMRSPTQREEVSEWPIQVERSGHERAEQPHIISLREGEGPALAEQSYWSGPWPGEDWTEADQPYSSAPREAEKPVEAEQPSPSERTEAEAPTEQQDAAPDDSEIDTAVSMPEGRQEVARRFMEALRPQRGLAETHYKRGITYLERGDPDGAIGHLGKALQLRPTYAEAWFDRGAAHAAKGDYDRAIADFDRAIELRPEDGDAYYNRGTAYLRKGDYRRALADFDSAIDRRPDLAQAFFSRGVTRQQLARRREATLDFRRFLTLSTDGHWRQQAEERLRQLQAGS